MVCSRYEAVEEDLVLGDEGREVPDDDLAAGDEVEGVKDLL